MSATWVHRTSPSHVPGTGMRRASAIEPRLARSSLLRVAQAMLPHRSRHAPTGRPLPCLANENCNSRTANLPQTGKTTAQATDRKAGDIARRTIPRGKRGLPLRCLPKRSCQFRPDADDLQRPFAARSKRIGAKPPRGVASSVSGHSCNRYRKKPSSRVVSCAVVNARAATLARSGRTVQKASRSRSMVNIA